MSALRAFRFQKNKASTPSSSQSSLASANGSPEPPATNSFSNGNASFSLDDSNDSIHPPIGKRPRLNGSESESGSPIKKNNGYGFGGMPSPDVVQSRLDLLSHAFPNKDRMDLQDTLRSCNFDTQVAIAKIRENIKAIQKQPSANTKKSLFPKKKAVKRHETNEASASESDEEGEYTDKRVVVSDDSDEYESGDEDYGRAGYRGVADDTFDDRPMTDDQRRVFDFFNEGTTQELACIQGCSKKKVVNIFELRPFESWRDLVSKVQMSRALNTDMLNNTTSLLRMRDTISRLMDKCEKITERMTNLVEKLMENSEPKEDGNSTKPTGMELTEQPKSISDGFKLKGYQMVGLNWLVLMHKQNLNGILADEMGLGKTIQAIAFLAHLKEMGDEGPHLVIVPSSTLDNWQNEFRIWCPSIRVLNYYGSQDERRHMRLQIVQEQIEYDVILATYNMVISSADDRVLFRKLDFHYVIYDEAHMLKNMATNRYENLMRVQATRKLLLTGTPLQNNLVELMSLLVFVMPDMFANKKEQLKKMFSMFPRMSEANERSSYEKDRIAHAKQIMKPFFLRRLKSEVLKDLPTKTSEVQTVSMATNQHEMYFEKVAKYKKKAKDFAEGKIRKVTAGESGVGMLMNLRKIANHPLLVRNHFDDKQLHILAKLLKKDESHKNAQEKFIIEDLSYMSDFEIHKTCLAYRCIEHYSLGNHLICESGKFQILDDILPQMNDNGDRILIFTQFVIVLDILEQYLRIRGHKYLRLDGSTPVTERQLMIDQYNNDESIFIFILSTRAGGLGINLTAANTVILHDLDFNPHNDKQAEDRCHRVGQTRPVKIIRFISEDTIEEGIYTIAQDKLQLEQDLSSNDDGEHIDKRKVKKDVSRLLKLALDVEITDDKIIGDVEKVYAEL